jgi:dTDP-4-dehydrorhamnose 3,5-epimerase
LTFTPTQIPGAWIVELDPIRDLRGHFARSFCQREFAARGLHADIVQCNVSHNARMGTLRGLHYQVAPHAEAKLVRCTRGSLFDVVVDLRPESPTYRRWDGLVLGPDPDNRKMLYVPEGCAHGFQTLEDGTDALYLMFGEYSPEHARGVRWDDPALGIAWPLPSPILSDKDRSYPLLVPDVPG